QRIHAVSASGNFFEVLGVQAQIGRVFTEDDDRVDATSVALLTDGLWHEQFGGTADALGRTITLNGIPHSFPFPGDLAAVRDSHIIAVAGRLKAGVTREQAQAQLTSVMASLSQ